MTLSSTRDTQVVERLRAGLTTDVVTPDDTDYDDARAVFSGRVDRRPAVIARPATATEVAHVVTVAAETGLDLAVRGGGHSGAGHGVCDDGIVLDLSALRTVDVDLGQRTAWAGTGSTAGAYTAEVGAHGLATGFGDAGSVGVGGITLGGGVGFLARRHGLTVDQLLAAEVVTADGKVRLVDAEHEPDLFWALRGGGGNFGVATCLRFRLQEVGTVYGGMLLLPATAEVVEGFVAAAEAAPDTLSTVANIMVAPPMPFVPPEYHGHLVVMALVCHVGSPEDGETVLAPFRALAPPIVDMVRPVPYPQMFPPGEEGLRPLAVGRSLFVDAVDGQAATSIIERLGASSAQMAAVQLRVLGGAVARVPDDATAYAHRQRRVMVNVGAMYQDPAEEAVHEAWVTGVASLLQDGEPSAYVNFLGDEGAARVRAAYPGPTWDRLREVKRRYDPSNLFRLNQNVPPA